MRSRSLPWRDIFPTLIFTVLMFALWLLAFANDEAMAHLFHHNARAWAIVLHLAIVAMPPVTALLPGVWEPRLARTLWGFALVLAMVGNVAGSVAHAASTEGASVTIRDVLEQGSALRDATLLVAVAGGAMIVVMEGIVGYLWESALRRLVLHFAATPLPLHRDAATNAATLTTTVAAEPASAATVAQPTPSPLASAVTLPEPSLAPARTVAVEFVTAATEEPSAAPRITNTVLVNVAPQTTATNAATNTATNTAASISNATAATLTTEERDALAAIHRGVANAALFTTAQAIAASPWSTTRTRELLNAATEAGTVTKLERGQWAFAATNDESMTN